MNKQNNTELKTLKDMEEIRDMYGDCHGMVNTWYLKKEVTKHVMWLNTLQGEGDYTDNEIECMKQILMEIHNITEEDLK